MVWPSFPSPESCLVADMLFSDAQTCPASRNPLLRDTIEGHPFNQVLQVIVPVKLPEVPPRGQLHAKIQEVKDKVVQVIPRLGSFLREDCQQVTQQQQLELSYITVSNVPLHLLFHKIFIEKYVLKGSITAVSTQNLISSDDCLCITPCGHLILSVTEKSYHRLGVDGKKSILYRRKNVFPKKIIDIDLKSKTVGRFEDSRYYTRIFNCLKNSGLKFDIVMKWVPDDKTGVVSSLSIAKYFDYIKTNFGPGGGFMTAEEASAIIVNHCQPRNVCLDNKGINHVPKTLMNASSVQPNDEIELLVDDVQAWTGCQVSGINSLRDEDSLDVNSFGFKASDCESVTAVLGCQSSGLFSSQDVMSVVSELESNLHLLQPFVPFVILTVSGFEESAVSWFSPGNEHGKKLSGENVYGILVSTSTTSSSLLSRKTLVWRVTDAYDFAIQKL